MFVTCEDTEAVAAQAAPLVGSLARLHAGADGVSITPAGSGSSASSASGNGVSAGEVARPAAQAGAVEKARSVTVVPLEDATPATAGAKAAACGELLRLAAACSDVVVERSLSSGGNGSANGTAVMAAADGVVLPFGCMEATLAADGQQRRYTELLQQLGAVLKVMQPGGGGSGGSDSLAALDGVCTEIQALLSGLRIPQAVRGALAFAPLFLAGWGLAAKSVLLHMLFEALLGGAGQSGSVEGRACSLSTLLAAVRVLCPPAHRPLPAPAPAGPAEGVGRLQARRCCNRAQLGQR